MNLLCSKGSARENAKTSTKLERVVAGKRNPGMTMHRRGRVAAATTPLHRTITQVSYVRWSRVCIFEHDWPTTTRESVIYFGLSLTSTRLTELSVTSMLLLHHYLAVPFPIFRLPPKNLLT